MSHCPPWRQQTMFPATEPFSMIVRSTTVLSARILAQWASNCSRLRAGNDARSVATGSAWCAKRASRSRSSTALSHTPDVISRRWLARLARDVVQVVDRVVDEVAGERLDREPRAVAAVAGALPLLAVHRVERGGEGRRLALELRQDRRGILLAVALRDRGGVLVPVRIVRVVLGQHHGEA